jgi:hypothetical protein
MPEAHGVDRLRSKQLRNFVSQGAGVDILDSIIAEAESQIEEIRRKVIV